MMDPSLLTAEELEARGRVVVPAEPTRDAAAANDLTIRNVVTELRRRMEDAIPHTCPACDGSGSMRNEAWAAFSDDALMNMQPGEFREFMRRHGPPDHECSSCGGIGETHPRYVKPEDILLVVDICERLLKERA